jgi:hypothetical protein
MSAKLIRIIIHIIMDQLCNTAECCIFWWLPQDLPPIHTDKKPITGRSGSCLLSPCELTGGWRGRGGIELYPNENCVFHALLLIIQYFQGESLTFCRLSLLVQPVQQLVRARGRGHEIATKIVYQLKMNKTVLVEVHLTFSTDIYEKSIQFMLYKALNLF